MTFKVKTKGQIECEDLLAPKLRFKEFKDELKKYKLKNIVNFYKGNNLSKSDITDNGIYPCILYGELYTKYSEIAYHICSKTNSYTKNQFISKQNDVLIPCSGETAIDISTSTCLLEDNILIGGDLNVLRPINQDGKYLSYLLCNKKRIIIAKYAQGDSIVHLYGEKISNIDVDLPSKKEQEKIADFLSLLDKKIELQQRRIEALKIYKKGLIQQLFNLNDCEEKHVSDFGNILTGTTPSKAISKYWTNGNIAWITPTDITESKDIYTSNEKLTIDGLNAGKFIPAGSILITCIASIGKNAILKVNGSCNQQINAIIPNDNFNPDYLYYLFELKRDYLLSIAGTSATSIINKSAFEKLVFKVHDIKVQNKIALILNCLELKFETEKSKLAKLRLLKESLLQQMFI